MKELLAKFLQLFSDWVAKMQDEDSEQAINKFKEASELTEEIQKKAQELEDKKQELEKYVNINISADDMKALMDEVKQLSSSNASLEKKVEELEKQKQEDDTVVSEALDKALDKIEEMQAELAKTVSKID